VALSPGERAIVSAAPENVHLFDEAGLVMPTA
jgi:hypothetical protein